MKENLKATSKPHPYHSLPLVIPGFFTLVLTFFVDLALDNYFITNNHFVFNDTFQVKLSLVGVFSFLALFILWRDAFDMKLHSKVERGVFSLAGGGILGGAMANIYDFTVYSAVIDYWRFPLLSSIVFNLSDVVIVVGLMIIVFFFFRNN